MTARAKDELHLQVEVPDLEESARVTVVRCGNTAAEVKEHGHAGSGDWAAWDGCHVISGGTVGYSFDEAMKAARGWARRTESHRLFHQALRRAIGTDGGR